MHSEEIQQFEPCLPSRGVCTCREEQIVEIFPPTLSVTQDTSFSSDIDTSVISIL